MKNTHDEIKDPPKSQMERNQRFGIAIVQKEASNTGAMLFDQKKQMNELKQLDSKIEAALDSKPKSAAEFKKEQAKKRRDTDKRKERGALEEVAQSFRLKQPSQFKSPFADIKVEEKRRNEEKKMKELQEQFWADNDINGKTMRQEEEERKQAEELLRQEEARR